MGLNNIQHFHFVIGVYVCVYIYIQLFKLVLFHKFVITWTTTDFLDWKVAYAGDFSSNTQLQKIKAI